MSILSKSRSLKLIAATVVLGLLAACSGHHGGEHRGGMMFDMIAYKLDFSDEQEALLGQIRSEVQLIRSETQSQRDGQRAEFITLFKAPRLDLDKLNSMMDNHKQHREEFAPRVMPLVVELHASLTDAQKDKVLGYMEKWHQPKDDD